MVFCSECGAHIGDAAKFCSNCGAKVHQTTIVSLEPESPQNLPPEEQEQQQQQEKQQHSPLPPSTPPPSSTPPSSPPHDTEIQITTTSPIHPSTPPPSPPPPLPPSPSKKKYHSSLSGDFLAPPMHPPTSSLSRFQALYLLSLCGLFPFLFFLPFTYLFGIMRWGGGEEGGEGGGGGEDGESVGEGLVKLWGAGGLVRDVVWVVVVGGLVAWGVWGGIVRRHLRCGIPGVGTLHPTRGSPIDNRFFNKFLVTVDIFVLYGPFSALWLVGEWKVVARKLVFLFRNGVVFVVLWGSLVGGVVVGWLVMVEATEVDASDAITLKMVYTSFLMCMLCLPAGYCSLSSTVRYQGLEESFRGGIDVEIEQVGEEHEEEEEERKEEDEEEWEEEGENEREERKKREERERWRERDEELGREIGLAKIEKVVEL